MQRCERFNVHGKAGPGRMGAIFTIADNSAEGMAQSTKQYMQGSNRTCSQRRETEH